MKEKINRKFVKFLKIIIGFFLIGLLVYTRFVGLNWGLPYPMHPDERNMAVAVGQLKCEIPKINFNLPKSLFENWSSIENWFQFKGVFQLKDCFNPHFYAYGQFPLYLSYVLILIIKFFDGDLAYPISFQEAVISLRLISVISSLLTGLIMFKIINLFLNEKKNHFFIKSLLFLIIIFSPYAIQFSHFGTTESLLMLFYSLIVYLTLNFSLKKISVLNYVIGLSIFSGLSLATKVSSLIFFIVPLLVLITQNYRFKRLYSFLTKIFDVFIYLFLSGIIFIIFSPHNLINFQDFLSAINYEKDVALGKYIVFYTRQFIETVPVLFQVEKIFPYALGMMVFFLFILGFFFLNWKDKKNNLLRTFFLIYFLPNAFVFAKWTRFMAIVFPIMTILAILWLIRIKIITIVKIIIVVLSVLPGINYLKVYYQPDIRFQASDWIFKNIPENSYVLSETANVVDIPIINQKSRIKNQNDIYKNYQIVSFNFYDLDENVFLQEELKNHLEKADYIFVPSRRIFINHYCDEKLKIKNSKLKIFFPDKCQELKKRYPLLNQYYNDLFSGRLGFKKVAEFDVGLGDEMAEETWTVFDHPVIRIYKKT